MKDEFVSKKELFLYKINKEISLIEKELQEKRKRIFLNYINDYREHDSAVSISEYSLQSYLNTYRLNQEIFDAYYLYLNICAQLLSADFSDGEYDFLLKRDNILTGILYSLQTLKEDADGTFCKHFIGLSDNVTYVIEDLNLGENEVDKYAFTITYNPNMWIPVSVETID